MPNLPEVNRITLGKFWLISFSTPLFLTSLQIYVYGVTHKLNVHFYFYQI